MSPKEVLRIQKQELESLWPDLVPIDHNYYQLPNVAFKVLVREKRLVT